MSTKIQLKVCIFQDESILNLIYITGKKTSIICIMEV